MLPLLRSDIQTSRERRKQTAPGRALLMFLDVDSVFFSACRSSLAAIDHISSAQRVSSSQASLPIIMHYVTAFNRHAPHDLAK